MKRYSWKVFICLLLVMLMSTGMAMAKKMTIEEKKSELQQKTALTLEKLYKKLPRAQRVIESAEGYAVFNNTGFKLGILGTAHGRGMAVNNATGEEVYMRTGEYGAGFGLGIKEYAIIFVFGTQESWYNFVNSGWKWSGEAEASATDSQAGDSFSGILNLGNNVWMYQMTTKGLSAEITIKGTEFFRDKSFYPEIYGEQ